MKTFYIQFTFLSDFLIHLFQRQSKDQGEVIFYKKVKKVKKVTSPKFIKKKLFFSKKNALQLHY